MVSGAMVVCLVVSVISAQVIALASEDAVRFALAYARGHGLIRARLFM